MCEYVFCRKIKLNLARKEKMVSKFVQNRRLMNFIFTGAIIRLKKVNQGVRTYAIHLLGTYVSILCNWLIL